MSNLVLSAYSSLPYKRGIFLKEFNIFNIIYCERHTVPCKPIRSRWYKESLEKIKSTIQLRWVLLFMEKIEYHGCFHHFHHDKGQASRFCQSGVLTVPEILLGSALSISGDWIQRARSSVGLNNRSSNERSAERNLEAR